MNTSNNKLLLLLVFLCFVVAVGHAQISGDFRTAATGNWATATTWQTYNGTTWVAATNYPGQNAGTYAVTILAGHTVTIPNTGITTAVMGTVTINGTLTLTGSSSTVVMFTLNTSNIYVTPGLTPLATIYFDTKCQLTLPADAVFRVWAGGLSGPCSNNNRII